MDKKKVGWSRCLAGFVESKGAVAPPPILSSKAKDKKEGLVESKGAVAVKDGGIGGMDG